jgi:sugar O-acyltransferase (sialic acid O-acetyltransferase NeuD family)
MHTDRWLVVGAGGHARVVMDALLLTRQNLGTFGFVDDNTLLHGHLMLGKPVMGSPSTVIFSGDNFHVAVGTNKTREHLYLTSYGAGGVPFTVIHPLACVSSFAILGQAVFIAARAVVAPQAVVGVGVIVNHGAVLDHDCVVGDFTHIAPGATLAGGVMVGRYVLIGAGANVLPGISIGDGAVIGAGAVVRANVSPGETVIGVPARPFYKN